MGQPLQNGPFTVQLSLSLPPDIKKAPFVVPTSIVTPSWFIAFLGSWTTRRFARSEIMMAALRQTNRHC
jgi:hypothetical protein